jgi:hypothetical protein
MCRARSGVNATVELTIITSHHKIWSFVIVVDELSQQRQDPEASGR